jgi:hypothetical protein
MSSEEMESQQEGEPGETRNWPELVEGVYDRLREDGEEGISIGFREMEIQVPSRTGEDADHAHWTIDGTIDFNPDE